MKFFAVVAICCIGGMAAAQDQHGGMDHAAHHHGVEARGEKAMGFSQTATTHHFILEKDGGYVQVTANDMRDSKSTEQIREHMATIEKKFAAGDFTAPEFTHDQVPPGVPEMQKLKAAIRYKVEQIDGGGRLHISSKDAKAIAAIHQFLKFQIEDHETGDAATVRR